MRPAALALACAALTACGVPTGDPPQPIPASDVPYGLAEPAPGSAAPTSAAAGAEDARVFFLNGRDLLVPRARALGDGTDEEQLDELLGALAAGPTEEELDEQLSTALRPDIDLSVEAFEDGVVTVDVDGAEGAQGSGENRRAVAQIVLTATSLAGVDAVLIAADGQTVEAPLPSGELTSEPLTADVYGGVVVPTPPGG